MGGGDRGSISCVLNGMRHDFRFYVRRLGGTQRPARAPATMASMKKRLEPFQQYLEHDLETADAYSNSTLVETLMHIGLVVWRFNALERSLDHAICIGSTIERTRSV